MIEFADKSMVPKLMDIWQECFGDPMEYIRLYFTQRFRPENTLVTLVKGEPVAMLTMLPCEVVADSGVFPSRYIYAVATHPSAQGRGYSSALLEYAHRWMRKHEICASLLVPAQPSLFQFYRKRGYLPAFSIREVSLSREELTQRIRGLQNSTEILLTEEIDPAELYALREEFYGQQGLFVRWDEEALSYVIEENRFTGGKILRFSTDSGHGYMICYKMKSIILVKECGAREERLLCKALLSCFKEDKFEIRLAADSLLFKGLGQKREFGAAIFLQNDGKPSLTTLSEHLTGQNLKDDSYLNLVLD